MEKQNCNPRIMAYSVRNNNVNFPYSSPSILGIPESGRVWIHTAREGLQAHIMTNLLNINLNAIE